MAYVVLQLHVVCVVCVGGGVVDRGCAQRLVK